VTSKGAVVGFTHALARELGPDHVTVNAIAPGAIPTDAEKIHPDLAAHDRHVLEHRTRSPGGGCQPERLAGTLTMRSTTAPSTPRRWPCLGERVMRRTGISAGVMSP
jgi:NAD(P)-dependent dehydrogenase (short-subunit alcohol dehydrogenase family)